MINLHKNSVKLKLLATINTEIFERDTNSFPLQPFLSSHATLLGEGHCVTRQKRLRGKLQVNWSMIIALLTRSTRSQRIASKSRTLSSADVNDINLCLEKKSKVASHAFHTCHTLLGSVRVLSLFDKLYQYTSTIIRDTLTRALLNLLLEERVVTSQNSNL